MLGHLTNVDLIIMRAFVDALWPHNFTAKLGVLKMTPVGVNRGQHPQVLK